MRLYTPTNQGQKTNQINFFFGIYHQSTEKMSVVPGTEVGWRGKGGGEGGNKMCDV